MSDKDRNASHHRQYPYHHRGHASCLWRHLQPVWGPTPLYVGELLGAVLTFIGLVRATTPMGQASRSRREGSG